MRVVGVVVKCRLQARRCSVAEFVEELNRAYRLSKDHEVGVDRGWAGVESGREGGVGGNGGHGEWSVVGDSLGERSGGEGRVGMGVLGGADAQVGMLRTLTYEAPVFRVPLLNEACEEVRWEAVVCG